MRLSDLVASLSAHPNFILVHYCQLSHKIYVGQFSDTAIESLFDLVFGRRVETQPDNAGCVLRRITNNVAEIGVQRNQYASRFHCGGTNYGIACATQVLFNYRNRIIAIFTQALGMPAR